MSDDLDDLILSIPCAYCGMWSHERCVTTSGRATTPHGPRRNPIYSAYGLGYTDYEKYLREKERRA